ncbi:MAG TPA: hypothetical protein VGD23_05200 [Sphingomicrobium sp.]
MNVDAKTRSVEKDSPEQVIRKLGRQVGLLKAEINRLRRGLNAMAQRFEPW